MNYLIPAYLQSPEVVISEDDTILNLDNYFPPLSIKEFEKNYQATDVFAGKTRYMLESAKIAVNSQITKVENLINLPAEQNATYRACVYACAMMMICQRYGSVDTKNKSEFEREKKENLALIYQNEFRRLLLLLNGSPSELT